MVGTNRTVSILCQCLLSSIRDAVKILFHTNRLAFVLSVLFQLVGDKNMEEDPRFSIHNSIKVNYRFSAQWLGGYEKIQDRTEYEYKGLFIQTIILSLK